MTLQEPSMLSDHPTGARALWGYLRDSTITELRSTLRLLVAPVRAIQAGSFEPIVSAFRRAQEDSDRVFARYTHSEGH